MKQHHFFGLLVGAWVLGFSAVASADQFVLVDADYAHTKQSHAYGTLATGQPANWKTPIDYADGTAYYRLEVFEKPSTENLNMGICFEGGSYCCFGYERFTKPGVYEWSFPIPSMWQFDTMDWSKQITGVPLIMRDRDAVKVDSTEAYYGAPSTALYFPMKSHLTVTIVSKGATYVKPDAGPAGDAGSDAATKDASVTKDSAIADAVGSGAAIGSDAAIDAGATDDAAPDAPDPTTNGDESSGCTASARPVDGSGSWVALALSWLLVTRRRRPT